MSNIFPLIRHLWNYSQQLQVVRVIPFPAQPAIIQTINGNQLNRDIIYSFRLDLRTRQRNLNFTIPINSNDNINIIFKNHTDGRPMVLFKYEDPLNFDIHLTFHFGSGYSPNHLTNNIKDTNNPQYDILKINYFQIDLDDSPREESERGVIDDFIRKSAQKDFSDALRILLNTINHYRNNQGHLNVLNQIIINNTNDLIAEWNEIKNNCKAEEDILQIPIIQIKIQNKKNEIKKILEDKDIIINVNKLIWRLSSEQRGLSNINNDYQLDGMIDDVNKLILEETTQNIVDADFQTYIDNVYEGILDRREIDYYENLLRNLIVNFVANRDKYNNYSTKYNNIAAILNYIRKIEGINNLINATLESTDLEVIKKNTGVILQLSDSSVAYKRNDLIINKLFNTIKTTTESSQPAPVQIPLSFAAAVSTSSASKPVIDMTDLSDALKSAKSAIDTDKYIKGLTKILGRTAFSKNEKIFFNHANNKIRSINKSINKIKVYKILDVIINHWNKNIKKFVEDFEEINEIEKINKIEDLIRQIKKKFPESSGAEETNEDLQPPGVKRGRDDDASSGATESKDDASSGATESKDDASSGATESKEGSSDDGSRDDGSRKREKYLKYKQKYLSLKKKMELLNLN
jgi:hypothetical protein